jgi:hypothetical protein
MKKQEDNLTVLFLMKFKSKIPRNLFYEMEEACLSKLLSAKRTNRAA